MISNVACNGKGSCDACTQNIIEFQRVYLIINGNSFCSLRIYLNCMGAVKSLIEFTNALA